MDVLSRAPERPTKVQHGFKSMLQIEDWERTASELIGSEVPEARDMGLALMARAQQERIRHSKGDYLTLRHWWDWERALREFGLR